VTANTATSSTAVRSAAVSISQYYCSEDSGDDDDDDDDGPAFRKLVHHRESGDLEHPYIERIGSVFTCSPNRGLFRSQESFFLGVDLPEVTATVSAPPSERIIMSDGINNDHVARERNTGSGASGQRVYDIFLTSLSPSLCISCVYEHGSYSSAAANDKNTQIMCGAMEKLAYDLKGYNLFQFNSEGGESLAQ
jgi:hypothetical protein